MRTWTVLLLLGATVLAGCASETEAPVDDFPAFDEDLQATEDTGVIRGVVVDETITPIVGATVALVGRDASTESNADGAFGFADLAPGFYNVEVSKLGYGTTQTQTEVVAAVDTPPVVRVVLQADPSSTPAAVGLVWNGYYTCSVSGANACAIVDIVLDIGGQGDILKDDTNTRIAIARPPSWYQSELVWEANQVLAKELTFKMEIHQNADEFDYYGVRDSIGESPLLHTLSPEEIAEHKVGNSTGVLHRIFPGDSPESAVFVQQDFTIYSHEFYNYAPPEGWRFTDDSQVPEATQ